MTADGEPAARTRSRGPGGSSYATRNYPEAMTDEPLAECVLCREPTEYPASTKGTTLCPVCEWREAERAACSG
ncbi:hypothetical protein [Streptomyces mesophilus]|uniref:hypothetical protein n=1 Tax=Streptomyces mesophilus TaxID=1775132 RepID=UPI0038B4AA6D